MPNWKKLIVSGSDASLNSLNITTDITASGDISASGDVHLTNLQLGNFTGDIHFGTDSTANKLSYNAWQQSASGGTTINNTAGTINFDSKGQADTLVISGSCVGIGTTTPGYPLHVIGDARIDGSIRIRNNDNISINGGQAFSGDVSAGTITIADHSSFLNTTIDSNITASGAISASGQIFGDKLNIATAEDTVAIFESTDQNSTVVIKDSCATSKLVHSLHAFKIQVDPDNVDGNSNFRIEIDNDEKFRIDNGGDVGIGTSGNAPQKLTVAGNVSASGKLYLDTVDNASSDPDKFLVLSGNEVEYRTGTQLLSDIGGQGSGNYVIDAGGAVCQVGVWSSATDMSGSACLLFDTSTNRLGIGDNTPCKTLTVDLNSTNTTVLTGNSLSGGGAGSGLLIQNAAVDSAGLYANLDFRAYNADGRIAYVYNGTNDGDFHFITDNGADPKTRFFIENDGKIGIGTTSPANTLHVSSSDEVVAKFQSSDNKAVIQISDDDTTGYISAENSRISIGPQQGLHANNINILTSNYNVGIGTATPTVDLDVRGNAIIAGSEPDAPVGTAATLEVYESGSDSILAIHQDDSSSSTKVAALRFRNGGNDTCLKVPTSNQGLIIDTEGKANAFVLGVCGQIQSAITASCNFSSSAQVLTNTLNIQGAVNADTDTDKFLVLDADGNVDFRTGDEVKTDIGAVSSGGVSDAGGANCQVAVWSSGTAISGSNDLFFDTANNRLGVGLSNPSTTLHVDGFARFQAIQLTNANAQIFNIGNSSLRLGTDNTERMRISATGSVGIGTTDPKAKLHVAGEISGSNNVRLEGDCLILGGGQTIIRNYSSYLGLFAAGGSAKDVKAKSLALTSDFGNSAPTNGLYVQGTACFGSNVVINGTVTAQEFNTELVSASVVFESGSTQFGNSLDDTHTFTGSILLSGSQTIDIGGRNLYFCSTGAGGWPQIDADANLFLGGGNAGNIQFMDHAIPSGDSSIDLGNANRYYRGLYADEAFLGNAISHVQTITGSVLVTGSTCLTGDLFLGDNRKVVLGSGTDMLLYHNGTDSVIDNNTGDLYITNKADNCDIIFRSDDGSEGFTEYFRLDGSQTILNVAVRTLFRDNVKATFGAGYDLEIYHDTTDNIIQSNVSRLRFYSGSSEFFRIQGGSSEATLFTKNVRLQDNVRLDVGGSTDGRFFHDGTDTNLVTITGDLIIKNSNAGGDIRFQSGSTQFFRVDGGEGRVVHSVNSRYIDNAQVMLGTGGDLLLSHNGSNSYISNNTGDLYIEQLKDDGDIIFKSDNGSGGTAEYFKLDGGLVQTIFTKPLVANGIISASGAITGSTLNLQGIVNAGTDTDKFLVLDSSGNVDFRTGANVLSDIGAQGSGNFVTDDGGAVCQVAVWSSGTAISGSNDLFFNTANNRLGIGTASPDSALHVNTGTGTGNANTVIIDRPASSDYSAVSFATAGTVDWSIGQNSANNLEIFEDGLNSKTRLTVEVGGNVGIGTDNPNQKLTVSGNIYANGGQLFVNNNCCLAAVGNLKLVTNNGSYNTTMFLSSSQEVGIGTITPERKLSVTDSSIVTSVFRGTNSGGHLIDLRHTNSADGYNGFRFYDEDTNRMNLTHIQTGTRGYVQIGNSWASGSEILVVDGDNERVGIGTNDPARNLHIHQGDSTLSYLQITNTTTGVGGGDGVSFGITSDEVAIWNNRENTDTSISTNNTERIRIKNDGKVGIGTTSPKESLHIVSGSGSGNKTVVRVGGNGDGNNESVLELVEHVSGDHMNYGYSFVADGNSTNNLLIKNHNNSTSGNTAISVERTTGRVGIGHSDTYGEVLDVSGSIVIRDIGSTRGIRRNNEAYDLRLLGGSTISNGAHISLGGDLRGGSGNSLAGAAVITQGGTDYANRASVSSSISFQVCSNAGSATDMFIQGCTGHIGIGTTSPARTLHIAGGGGSTGGIMIAPTSGDAEIQFQDSGTTNAYITLDDGTQDLNFRDDTATVMTIDFGSERVGIGTAAPQAHFNVSGSSTIGGSVIGNARILAGSTTQGIGIDSNEIAVKGDHLYVGTLDSKDIIFRTQGTSARARITSAGNLAIGTSSAPKTLTVAGDISGSGRLHIDTVDNASSDTDKILVLNGNEVEYRTGTQILSDVGGVPKVVYESLSSAIAVDGTKTIPSSLSYTLSSNNYEYLEVFLDGIRLARDIDYSETNTTTITSLIAIPSASVLTFKILG